MADLRAANACGPTCLTANWKTATLIGGLRLSGMTTPMVRDGAMTAAWFLAYVGQILVPTRAPGDIVILDNLAAHKSAAARAAIEMAGARLLFLPPYSPDLNPIENALSKLKAPLRRPPHEPSNSFGRPSLMLSAPSHATNAPTTSPQPGMMQTDRKVL